MLLFIASQDYWQAFATLAIVTLAASCLARWWPAYRVELSVETHTRQLSLDGVRGILCFAVMVHHAACTLQYFQHDGTWTSPASHVYTMFGGTSVCLFFCITGFLFWGRILRRTGGLLDWFDFARGRALRIVPMYAAAAIPVLIIATTQLVQIRASAGQIGRFWAEVSTVGVLNWHPVTTPGHYVIPSRINAGVHWSLGYEWGFYAALPLLALLARGRRPWVIWIGWIVALAVGARLHQYTYLTMFPIGMIAAHATRHVAFANELRRPRYAILVLVAFALIAVLGSHRDGVLSWTADTRSPLSHLLLLIAFVPMACGNTLFGLLARPSLRLMGTISYGVYLTHGIVLYVSRPLLVRLVQDASDANVAFWAATAGLAVVTLLLASVTYLAVERPFVELEHRLRRRRRDSVTQGLPPVSGGTPLDEFSTTLTPSLAQAGMSASPKSR